MSTSFSASPDLANLTPPKSKNRNDSFLHVRSASGGEEMDCFCFGEEKVGRRPGDLRLGCMCLVHYDCLVAYIRVSLGDKARLMRTFSMSDDSQMTGILCPYYSPQASQCRFSTKDILSSFSYSFESVDQNVELRGGKSRYYLTVDDLENLVTFGAALEKLKSLENEFDQNNPIRNQPLSEDEVQKLKGWIAEESPIRRTPTRSALKFSRSIGVIPEDLLSASSGRKSRRKSSCIISSQSGDSHRDGNSPNPSDNENPLWIRTPNSFDRSTFAGSFDTPSPNVRRFSTPFPVSSPPVHQPNAVYSNLICGDCKIFGSDLHPADIQSKPSTSPLDIGALRISESESVTCFCGEGCHPPSLLDNEFQLHCNCKVNMSCFCKYIKSSLPSFDLSMFNIPCPYASIRQCKFTSESGSRYFLSVEEIEKIVCFLKDNCTTQSGGKRESMSKIENSLCLDKKTICFCNQQFGEVYGDSSSVSDMPAMMLRLQCSCAVHFLCLTSYLRYILAQSDDAPLNSIQCPNVYFWQEQNGIQGCDQTHPSISSSDLKGIATIGAKIQENDRRKLFYKLYNIPIVSSSKSELHSSATLYNNELQEIECLSQEELLSLERIVGCDDEISVTSDSAPSEQQERYLFGKSSSSSSSTDDTNRHATDAYICATTKTCPSCNMRATHYHGHACHHISPSGGCPSCGTHYCYKCQSTADENILVRGTENSCACGFWSNFCGTFKNKKDIDMYLVILPYPHDSRCGCAICPECKENAPCSLCSGHCDVCLGNIYSGPQELVGSSWIAQSEESKNRMAVDNILVRLAALCAEQQLCELRAALDVELTNIDARDSSGKTLLHYASSSSGGNVNVIKMLVVEYGAKVDVRNSFGTTALHYASSNGYEEVVAYIIGHLYSSFCEEDCHSMIHSQDNELKTPLFYASFRGHMDVVKLLLRVSKDETNLNYPLARRFCEIVDIIGWTALHCAAFGGHTSVVDLLCNTLQVDVNILTENGKSALHIAMEKGLVDIVRILASNNSTEVNRPDNTKSTPLHYSCRAGHEDCVRVLLSVRTVTLCIQNKFGKTCLHYACERGHVGIVRLLLSAKGGALSSKTVNARSNLGLTALELAILSHSDRAATVQQLILYSPEGEEYRKKMKNIHFITLLVFAIRAFNWNVFVRILRILFRVWKNY